MHLTPVSGYKVAVEPKAAKKEQPRTRPEPSPVEKLFLFILFELENIKKSGKPKT